MMEKTTVFATIGVLTAGFRFTLSLVAAFFHRAAISNFRAKPPQCVVARRIVKSCQRTMLLE